MLTCPAGPITIVLSRLLSSFEGRAYASPRTGSFRDLLRSWLHCCRWADSSGRTECTRAVRKRYERPGGKQRHAQRSERDRILPSFCGDWLRTCPGGARISLRNRTCHGGQSSGGLRLVQEGRAARRPVGAVAGGPDHLCRADTRPEPG